LYFAAKIGVGPAGFGEERLAVGGRTFGGGVADRIDPPPAFGRNGLRGVRAPGL
jgi:hypothetical protein